MANALRPSGLSPVKHLITGNFNGQGNLYQIAAADTNAYYIGDPVVSSGSGDANGVPGVTLAAATGALRGVILGMGPSTQFGPGLEAGLFNVNNLNQTFRPGAAQATDWYCLVADDPNIIFEVSEPSTGTPLTAAAIGFNVNLVVGTGNGFQSGWTISNTGAATTSTLQMRLLGLARRQDNAFGLGARWLAKINVHELSAGTAGV